MNLSSPVRRSARVLLVDDTPTNLDVLQGLLEPLGLELSTANSGERALQVVQRLTPDLILLDIMMPGIDGIEVCRRLKAAPATADIPVIFVTGAGDNVDAGFAAGGVDYLVKPVRANDLRARVSAHLERGWLLRELAERNASLEEARRTLERRVEERTRELSVANSNLHNEVQERRVAEDRLNFLARHDFLTRLMNRPALESSLAQLLAAGGQRSHCLIHLDLDRFKVVNDICGHVAGDELLREISELLRRELQPLDLLARMSGDEFTLVLVDADLARGRNVAERLRKAVEAFRFSWQNQVFTQTTSVGLTSVASTHGGVQELLGQADAACFAAKEEGRNRVHVYDERIIDIQSRRAQLALAPRLTEALEKDSFELFSQRILRLDAPEVGEHYELLLRMRDAEGQLIEPADFIPAAERLGMMPQVDRWVVRRVFRFYRENPEQLLRLDRATVNLSGQSLCDPAFDAFVADQLAEGGLPADKLCFEITETAAITNLQSSVRFMHKFRRAGVRFALDDFGAGVSSFAYLKTLPVDFLKIDGMFVKDIAENPVDRAMVRAINEIGQVMGRQTVAEFAETDEIVEILRQIGVNYAQGFGVARPQALIF
ncbi:EAL domain-containing protein [Burkholderiaceae bacterium UC74_6]